MLSHNIGSKQADKDESPSTGGGGGGGVRKPLRPPDKTLKCPRCDSPNTKFCYYNNYNLAQPRHFCKACRRYWTKGGALRNVPIGGSCRKNKKTKSCSSRFFIGEPSSKSSSSDIEGMKFYGLSSMDSQIGGLNFPPRFLTTNHFSSSYGDTLSNNVNLDPLGFNFPLSSSHIAMKQVDHHQQQKHNPNEGGLASFHEIMGTRNNHLHNNTDLASSIESLSSINQDLHWKLQQQRLATLLGGDGGGGSGGGREDDQQQQKKQDFLEPHNGQKLQPILFQNLEISKPAQSSMDGVSRKDAGGGNGGGLELATEWFFDDSYAPGNVNHATPTNSNSGGNDQSGSINNWNIAGIEDWNNLKQYSEIP